MQEQSKFSQWVRRFGVANLADAMTAKGPDLAVTVSAIYQWLAGTCRPRFEKTCALVELSKGEISLTDISAHFTAAAANSVQQSQAAD